MPKGGTRPGAGRPPGIHTPHKETLSKEAAREVARTRILRDLEPMIEAQVSHAKGLKYLVVRDVKTGKFTKVTKERMDALLESDDHEALEKLEIWEKDPSVQAFTDLLNRALDKPREQVQEIKVTGELELVQGRLLSARKRVSSK